ncbi:NifU-like protein [Smittium culicis]|uniref:NifU-like protein n=1 Tax=Smittium culicis TaxID=133412 RepID=A0A1R1Y2M4_9FUNG|nr:NifU-like protein [Smittium culicis]
MFIQTERTPNENALKFLTGSTILEDSNVRTIEFRSRKDALKSPLALKLFGIVGIESVMFGADFITVTKDDSSEWHLLKPELFSIIMEHLSTSKPILGELYYSSEAKKQADAEKQLNESEQSGSDELSQIISEIKELLDTRIRPSIMEDGGDLEFVSFDLDTGTLKVSLQGACRGCSSSEVTLKNGIENMLTYYIPEVKIVENTGSELEELSKAEFEKFQQKLN